jgi:hypothetical protein
VTNGRPSSAIFRDEGTKYLTPSLKIDFLKKTKLELLKK